MTSLAFAPATDPCEEIAGELVCTAVVRETHDVLSFTLRSPTGSTYTFQPGQYVTVTVDMAGTPTSRCYSISSSPLRGDELTITVKRVAGGPVSGWLHDNLRPGGTLAVTGPLGSFSTDRFPADRHLFLSAGSGITPAMSMLRALCETGAASDVVFVQHARTPADLIFRDDLEVLEAAQAGVRLVLVCEGDSADERWVGQRGRLSVDALRDIAPDLVEREVFLCGPAAYLRVARDCLAAAGADSARCHEESFDLQTAALPPPPLPSGDAEPLAHTVELRRTGRTITCDSDTPILVAAARAGLTLPSSCGEGMCGTCKTTLLSGRVDMTHAGGIRPREIAQDKILLCCSIPTEQVVLDA